MKTPLPLKFKVARNGLWTVYHRPTYIIGSALMSITALGLLLWSLNLEVLRFLIVEAVVPVDEKFSLLASVFENLFVTVEPLQSVAMIIFSVLIGINLSLLVFVLLRRIKITRRTSAQSIGGAALAVIAGGCAACGVSLLTPLLATIGVTSLYSAQLVSSVISWLGIVIVAWSIFLLAIQAANASATSQ